MTANPTGSRTERAGAAGAQRRGHVSLACWRRAGAHRRGPRGCCCSLGIVTFKKKKKIAVLLTAENKRRYQVFRKPELEDGQSSSRTKGKLSPLQRIQEKKNAVCVWARHTGKKREQTKGSIFSPKIVFNNRMVGLTVNASPIKKSLDSEYRKKSLIGTRKEKKKKTLKNP